MSEIELGQIRTDGGTQPRAHIYDETVVEYAEAMKPKPFPPVVLYFDGQDYWLADGFHRVQAAMQIGRKRIDADIRQGTQRDAVLHSVGANAEHGLRRTNEDKRRAVLTLLRDAEWSHWSDRKIAKTCSVNPHLVAELRQSICENSQMRKRRTVERNGKTYMMDTSSIGKDVEPAPTSPIQLDSDPPSAVSAAAAEPPTPMSVHYSSESAEWRTPDSIIRAVVLVMGQIDLDPCSNSRYAPNVPAQAIYTREEDGLSKRWRGRVYMNPPYGDEIGLWIEKLLAEYEHGEVREAIALVPARTDTKWFQRLFDYAICFVHGRLKFKGANGECDNSAPFPSAVVYLGDRLERFTTAFEPLGPLVSRYDGLIWKTWAGRDW